MKILILNGPNINFLGIREPEVYGIANYDDLCNYLMNIAIAKDINLLIKQTNSEGKIIDILQECHFDDTDYIILNAGAYTHYSYAISDAIKAIQKPVIEVHLSNILEREDYRKKSVIQDSCVKTFMGKGFESYKEAINYCLKEEGKDEN